MTASATELIKERAKLLARVSDIDAALEALADHARPWRVTTHKNLRNTGLRVDGVSVTVYTDESLTTVQSQAAHGGYVPAQTAADLIAFWGKEKLDDLGVELEEVE